MGQHSRTVEPDDTVELDAVRPDEEEAHPYVKGLLDGIGVVCVLVLLAFAVGWLL
jgi:hypothetical protein